MSRTGLGIGTKEIRRRMVDATRNRSNTVGESALFRKLCKAVDGALCVAASLDRKSYLSIYAQFYNASRRGANHADELAAKMEDTGNVIISWSDAGKAERIEIGRRRR